MTTYIKFDDYIKNVTDIIIKNHEEIAQLHQEIDVKMRENENLMKQLKEAIKDRDSMKKLQSSSIPSTKPQPFESKLATMSSTTTEDQIVSFISMSDKLKYPPETIAAYEKIIKFYEYKTNRYILRSVKVSKYPRYLCNEKASPEVVEKLFNYGFIDKILVDETLYSISKLPTLIIDSIQKMIESFGNGIFGIQIFDACTDLVGKPIVLCQLFRVGRNTEIAGDYANLSLPVPCTLEQFQEWISMKRAIGLSTLANRIDGMIRMRKANIIGTCRGAVEEMITLYYDNDTISRDTTELERMRDRIMNLQHSHATKTKELYQSMAGPRKRPVFTTNTTNDVNMLKGEGSSSDPFM